MPIILGRPFLYTGRANFDLDGSKLTLRVGEEIVTFSMEHAGKCSHEPFPQDSELDDCAWIDERFRIEALLFNEFVENFRNDQRTKSAAAQIYLWKQVAAVTFGEEDTKNTLDNEECEEIQQGGEETVQDSSKQELNQAFTPKLLPSTESPPKVELKELP